jgi:hypothetical protein
MLRKVVQRPLTFDNRTARSDRCPGRGAAVRSGSRCGGRRSTPRLGLTSNLENCTWRSWPMSDRFVGELARPLARQMRLELTTDSICRGPTRLPRFSVAAGDLPNSFDQIVKSLGHHEQADRAYRLQRLHHLRHHPRSMQKDSTFTRRVGAKKRSYCKFPIRHEVITRETVHGCGARSRRRGPWVGLLSPR